MYATPNEAYAATKNALRARNRSGHPNRVSPLAAPPGDGWCGARRSASATTASAGSTQSNVASRQRADSPSAHAPAGADAATASPAPAQAIPLAKPRRATGTRSSISVTTAATPTPLAKPIATRAKRSENVPVAAADAPTDKATTTCAIAMTRGTFARARSRRGAASVPPR